MTRLFKISLVAAALLVACAPFASASGHKPGSVLIYPVYDSDPGSGTLISITNTKDDPSFNQNTNLNGVVDVHFVYIDGDYWSEFNRYERLTPNDTFSTLASAHNPNSEKGFLYCIAIDPNTHEPMSFNHLIGDEIVADGSGNWLVGFDAIAFKSLAAEGQPGDIDGDERIDLDGVEYEAIADEMYISSFVGDTGNIVPSLVLVSLVPSSDFRTRIDFEVFNDNEQQFSATYNFRCWAWVELKDIDSIFTSSALLGTNVDPRANGLSPATGWARLDGDDAVDVVGNEPKLDDPPFVGAVLKAYDYFSAGHLLHESDDANGLGGVLDTLQ
ncbi:MAG: hypothetical protein RL885_32310 [Planctomycetota bacterium]